jgi:hypothetical protein
MVFWGVFCSCVVCVLFILWIKPGVKYYVIKFASGFPGTPVSFTNKTDRHDIAEIMCKVALNTIKQTNKKYNSQA